MQILETETSFAFPIGEKLDRKDDAVHQTGQKVSMTTFHAEKRIAN
jgi:hypothetical protein